MHSWNHENPALTKPVSISKLCPVVLIGRETVVIVAINHVNERDGCWTFQTTCDVLWLFVNHVSLFSSHHLWLFFSLNKYAVCVPFMFWTKWPILTKFCIKFISLEVTEVSYYWIACCQWQQDITMNWLWDESGPTPVCNMILNWCIVTDKERYVIGSKSFRPDIQKPRQMENVVRGI